MTKRIVTAGAAGIALIFALACGGSSIDTSIFVSTTGGGGTTTCPASAATGESFADGARVVLLGIHTDDAYAGSEWESKMPLGGKVQGDLHNNGECWFGGGFLGDEGTDFYFYKAAFKAE
ncbi:MAG: hypothetical protein JRI25_03605 [Deltaproteobacteria bacterium]|nr:hypothetical protein [Deltaproteobacteria bacterium]MBW2253664.1 hypothetical protein [Deltaproteobacteria bacterium]